MHGQLEDGLKVLQRAARWLILLSALLLPLHAVAQDSFGDAQDLAARSRAAQYFLGDADAIFITVNVWGKVGRPGQYNIPSGTDLLTLLSAAGGPTERSRLDSVRIVRMVNQREEIIEVDVKRYIKTGDLSLIPEMKPGDTVIVAGSVLNVVAFVVDLAAKVGILLNAIVLMQRLD
jgi:polysaccharide biosynthesis/export protein